MIRITRDNVEGYLDRGLLYAGMTNGNWWRLRRNGRTQTWKRDKDRLYIPVKAGLRTTTRITEHDFRVWDSEPGTCLNPEHFRHVDDVPVKGRGKRGEALEA